MNEIFERIAIVGAGAIGLYYGGRLAAAGEDLHFLVRSDYEGLSQRGLKCESVHGDFELPDPQLYRNSAEIGPVDLVIVTWKATANEHLAQVLPPLLHDQTRVLTLQNGLGNCEAIAAIIGPERVLGGLCFVCINRMEAGRIVHSGGGKVSIGSWHPQSASHAQTVTALMRAAGIKAHHVDRLEQAQWEKLIWNIPFNGLSVAEGGVTTDVLLADPARVDEIRALMMEVIATANALGLELDEALAEDNIERTRPMGAYRTSSMIDFVEGREVELGPIWEEPIRRAREIGVPMPGVEALFDLIRAQLAMRQD
ncbi:MAG: 2-dehydropantoate 2-reductase [Akkermansiaceae bacterium]|nr:2-dehydropantoate 2-reductase [Akkermansiaceae bacterium]